LTIAKLFAVRLENVPVLGQSRGKTRRQTGRQTDANLVVTS